jgi:predicted RNA-binding Zn-ribbon protein involved in translation (DUF1610 family)
MNIESTIALSEKKAMLELKGTPSSMHSCPNCGKASLAQVDNERYTCLWCGFHRNISRSNGRGGEGSGGFFFFLLIAVFLFVVLLG